MPKSRIIPFLSIRARQSLEGTARRAPTMRAYIDDVKKHETARRQNPASRPTTARKVSDMQAWMIARHEENPSEGVVQSYVECSIRRITTLDPKIAWHASRLTSG